MARPSAPCVKCCCAIRTVSHDTFSTAAILHSRALALAGVNSLRPISPLQCVFSFPGLQPISRRYTRHDRCAPGLRVPDAPSRMGALLHRRSTADRLRGRCGCCRVAILSPTGHSNPIPSECAFPNLGLGLQLRLVQVIGERPLLSDRTSTVWRMMRSRCIARSASGAPRRGDSDRLAAENDSHATSRWPVAAEAQTSLPHALRDPTLRTSRDSASVSASASARERLCGAFRVPPCAAARQPSFAAGPVYADRTVAEPLSTGVLLPGQFVAFRSLWALPEHYSGPAPILEKIMPSAWPTRARPPALLAAVLRYGAIRGRCRG